MAKAGLYTWFQTKKNWWTGHNTTDHEVQYKNLANILVWAASNNVSLKQMQDVQNVIVFATVYKDAEQFQNTGTSYGSIPFIGTLLPQKEYNEIFSAPLFAEKSDTLVKNEVACWAKSGDGRISKIFIKEYFEDVPVGSYNGARTEDIDQSKWKEYVEKTTLLVGKVTCVDGEPEIYYSGVNWDFVLEDMIKLKAASSTAAGDGAISSVTATLLPDLASYFRYNAYEKKLADDYGHMTGVMNGNERIENMLMYAVLVVQSVILFIAYIKRLFYVLMLGLMAPIVVVFDFFQKFGK